MRHLDHSVAVIQAEADRAKSSAAALDEMARRLEAAQTNHVAALDKLKGACQECQAGRLHERA